VAGERLSRVLLGAGLTRGVDGLLCLIDFFRGGFRARREEQDRAHDRAQPDGQTRHQHESIAGYGVR